MSLSIFCGLTSSFAYNDCDKFAGGLVKIAASAYSSSLSPVWTYGAYNIITGATGVSTFYNIDQTSRIEFTNWVWTPDDTTNRGAMGTLVCTFFVYGVDAENIAKVEGMNNSLFRVIIGDQNGKHFLIGHNSPAICKITNAGSGAAGADIPGFEMTFTVKTKNIIFEMSEGLALSLITN